MKQVHIIFLMLVIGVILFPAPAKAYLDPGSGSMLLQLLLGGFAGLVIIVKLYWHSFISFFKPKKEDKSVSSNKEKDDTL